MFLFFVFFKGAKSKNIAFQFLFNFEKMCRSVCLGRKLSLQDFFWGR